MPEDQRQTTAASEKAEKTVKEYVPAKRKYPIFKEAPVQCAIMPVLPGYGSKEQYKIILGAHGFEESLETRLKNRPDLVIAKMMTGDENSPIVYPEKLWMLIQTYSHPNLRDLDRKLKELCKFFGDKAWYLIISDRTNFDIPWEMIIYLESEETDEEAFLVMQNYKTRLPEKPFEHPYYWAGFVFFGTCLS